MNKENRKWTAEQKLQSIMPVLRGEVSLAEQARRLKVPENQLYKWRDQANQALLEAFRSGVPSSRERELEEPVTQLEQLCGKQAVQIDLLKKHACCRQKSAKPVVGGNVGYAHASGVLLMYGNK